MPSRLAEIGRQALATALPEIEPRPTPLPRESEAAPRGSLPPAGVGEVFESGLSSGLEGLASSGNAFKAVALKAIGAPEEKISEALEDMRYRDEIAQRETEGIDTFEEFLSEPTLGGFIDQVALATGELAPSLSTSIVTGGAGALAGGLVATLGKTALNAGAKKAARHMIRDELKKKLAGEALDPDAEDVLAIAYQGLRKTVAARRPDIADALKRGASSDSILAKQLARHGRGSFAKRGAFAGASTAEYPFAAGEAGSGLFDPENLGTDGKPSKLQALGALALGVPAALIGTSADAIALKGLAKLATKRQRATGSSVYVRALAGAATSAARTGVAEGTAEGLQESLQIGYREATDPGYVAREGTKPLMRVAEAVFKGTFGSIVPGAIGGAGAGIVPKARRMADRAEKGDFLQTGTSTAEPVRDVVAQLDAVGSPRARNVKDTAYFSPDTVDSLLAGGLSGDIETAVRAAAADRSSEVFQTATVAGGGRVAIAPIEENGRVALAAVRWRGRREDKASLGKALSEFVKSGNDDETRRVFLGHHDLPSEESVVLEVLDAEGAVKHQTAVEPAREAEERASLERGFPGSEIVSRGVDEAVELRAERVEGVDATPAPQSSELAAIPAYLRGRLRTIYRRIRERGADPLEMGRDELLAQEGVGAKLADAFAIAALAKNAFRREADPQTVIKKFKVSPPSPPPGPGANPAAPTGPVGKQQARRRRTIIVQDDSGRYTLADIMREVETELGTGPKEPETVRRKFEDAVSTLRDDLEQVGKTDAGGDPALAERARTRLRPLVTETRPDPQAAPVREAEMRQIAGRWRRATRPETRRALRARFVEAMRDARYDHAYGSSGPDAVFESTALTRTAVRRILAASGVASRPDVESAIANAVLGRRVRMDDPEDGADDSVFHVERPEEGDPLSAFAAALNERDRATYDQEGEIAEQSYHETEWNKSEKRGITGWKITREEFSGVPEEQRAEWEAFLGKLSPAERDSFRLHEKELSGAAVTAILGEPARHVGLHAYDLRREYDGEEKTPVLRLYRTPIAEAEALLEVQVDRQARRLGKELTSSYPDPRDPKTRSPLFLRTPDGTVRPLHRYALLRIADTGKYVNQLTKEGLQGMGMSGLQAVKQGFVRGIKELSIRDWTILASADPTDVWDPLSSESADVPVWKRGRIFDEKASPAVKAREHAAWDKAAIEGDPARTTLRALFASDDPNVPLPGLSAAEIQERNGLYLGDYLELLGDRGRSAADRIASMRRAQRELFGALARAFQERGLVEPGKEAAAARKAILYNRTVPLDGRTIALVAAADERGMVNQNIDREAVGSAGRDILTSFLRSVRRTARQIDIEKAPDAGVWLENNPASDVHDARERLAVVGRTPDPALQHLRAASESNRPDAGEKKAILVALDAAERREAARRLRLRMAERRVAEAEAAEAGHAEARRNRPGRARYVVAETDAKRMLAEYLN